MSTSTLTESICAGLQEAADPARAVQMRAYLRDQFQFLGVPTPARRAIVVRCDQGALGANELFEAADQLWDFGYREYQHAAIDLLAHNVKQIPFTGIPQLIGLARRYPWWDSVDGITSVINRVIRRHLGTVERPHQHMDAALDDQTMWVRRIAMTHQLGWRLHTDTERLARYALALAHEREFFIQKAIGWALRDYARWNRAFVQDFNATNRSVLSALTLREAAKHLAD